MNDVFTFSVAQKTYGAYMFSVQTAKFQVWITVSSLRKHPSAFDSTENLVCELNMLAKSLGE